MALQECGKGHIYDTDIYPQCPYCRKVANSAPFGGLDYGATVAPQGYAATPVSLDYGATVAPQGYVRVLGRLAELTDRGVEVVFYAGNHDMWCLDYLTRECGVRVVLKPQVESIAGRSVHLAHGDNMNIKGQPMLRLMNSLFRSGVARWLFRWLIHPDFSMRLGRMFSGKSRKSHSNEIPSLAVLEPLKQYAKEHHKANGDVATYIFGHMHIPHHAVCEDIEMLFLSDWSREEATYAQMDGSSVELKTFKIDETIS